MKEIIRQRARSLGFDDCRFTTAGPPASAPHFRQWLDAGHQGTMSYLERNADKRVDPQQVLLGARSVICLVFSYAQTADLSDGHTEAKGTSLPLPASPEDIPPCPPHGVVARYARHLDYHDVIASRLKALAEFITEIGGHGTRSLWYVDTGPVLERDLAQRAGLGFIGKHANLISRHLGNWILLSEILTTTELEPDAADHNHCGHCARCLAACPTGAILEPFKLDARLCISYLTIELKGSIPIKLRRAIGNRIFGCDDCLAACPWNRFAREGNLMKAQARPELGTLDLLELLALDDAGFKHRFAGTPILRSKRRGLLRNVCVALGNRGNASALPALRRAAQDPEPLIAEHARWAILEIEGRTTAARPSQPPS